MVADRSSPRIVSLVPSVTETLVEWGLRPVGVTRFCEQDGIPTVGGTKNPDIPAIVALRPDLVVVDKEENRKEDAEALRDAGVRLHVLHVTSVEEVGPALGGLATACGIEPPALDGPPPAAATNLGGPSVANVWVPIWRRPWMALGQGTYGASLLALCGFVVVTGRSLASEPARTGVGSKTESRYPEVSLEGARSASPRWVIAPSEPYPFGERHREELESVAPTVLVDGRDLFWWGVRTPRAVTSLLGLKRRLAGGITGRTDVRET